MMRDDDVRFTLFDGTLNELHQLQMRHRVHLDVRESPFILLVHPDIFQCRMRIIIQFLVIRTERTRLRLCAHNA